MLSRIRAMMGGCIVAFFWLLLTSSATAGGGEIIIVSIVNLIATPRDFDEKSVVVRGVLSATIDGAAIFLTRDDAEMANFSNGVWLEADSDQAKTLVAMSGAWVSVTGTYCIQCRGHGGYFSGGIQKIERLVDLTIK